MRKEVKSMKTTQRLQTFVVTGTTDNSGNFTIQHGMTSGASIVGITAAIQGTDNQWHPLFNSNGSDNGFAWSDTNVNGDIRAGSMFANRPVKVIIFAQ
jgi:hypothetical protein